MIIASQMQQKSLSAQMTSRFVLSDCLLRYGYRQLSIDAQDIKNDGRVDDYLTIIIREARSRQDDYTIDTLRFIGLIG